MSERSRLAEWTLTARWVFPVDGPPLERGLVTVRDDRIAAVEPWGDRTPDVDLGNTAVLPGLVNAHTHLDLTGLRGRCPPTADFTAWLRQVIAHRRAASPKQIQTDIRAGLAEALRFGTTLVGDISGDGASWDVLQAAPVRAVVFREMLGLTSARADQAWADTLEWLHSHSATADCRPGLSPHAPYSVRVSLLQAAAQLARQRRLPVAIHVAESPDELSLLQGRSGPFLSFLTELGVWDPDGLIDNYQSLLEMFRDVPHVAFIHANYLVLGAVEASARAALRVVCPRTRSAFGFFGGPLSEGLPESLASRVALGTDSLASSPDLDVLAEARFLHRQYPEIPGATLLRLATLSGAEILGWQDETGSLTPGKSADLAAVALPEDETADPHQLVLEGNGPVRRMLFRGLWLQVVPS